ncbi:MAG TPA: hypothetical protein VEL75_02165 [Candidatus Methylomirabilis sp.]|nr:hypothetical protein [Candidatus Methylomirabilis sp.]
MRISVMAAAVFVALGLPGIPSLSLAATSPPGVTRQVESGARASGNGVEDAARGVGNAVAESARLLGERLKEAGKAAEPEARVAWRHARAGAVAFGQSVKSFFTVLVAK